MEIACYHKICLISTKYHFLSVCFLFVTVEEASLEEGEAQIRVGRMLYFLKVSQSSFRESFMQRTDSPKSKSCH